MKRIYLDNNATTAVDPYVYEAVLQELKEAPGNPSSVHYEGRRSRNRLNQARESIAYYLHIDPSELIFTSGGTEGAAYLLNGFSRKTGKGHLITTAIEHSCVYHTVESMKNEGWDATYLPVGEWGAVQPEDLESAIKPETKLIILMAANNETGVQTDLHAIAKIAIKADIPLIVDGVALLGKEQFSIPEGVSAMFFSGHKIHAPKGIGALFLRRTCKIEPLYLGGSQEWGNRAGTENLPGIVGLAAAIRLLKDSEAEFIARMRRMRDYLERGLESKVKQIKINGQGPRVSNTSNVSFKGINGESLLLYLDKEVMVSHGSACSSGTLKPSRILLKMGLPADEVNSSLRFSVSRWTTEQEIDRCIEMIAHYAEHYRKIHC